MNRRAVCFVPVVLLFPVLCSAVQAAGPVDDVPRPPIMSAGTNGQAQWGTTQLTSLQIPAAAFVPRHSRVVWSTQSSPTAYGFMTASILPFWNFDGEQMWASVELPTGAVVEDFAIHVLDTDTGIDPVTVSLRLYSGLQAPTAEDWYTLSNSGKSPSPQYLKCSDPGVLCTQAPNRQVFNEGRQMAVLVRWPEPISGKALPKFKGAEILWRRVVSPPPAFATFVDVPELNPFYPFVEALVSAGITGGCICPNPNDPGRCFCPNVSVTRGETAVFLSRALGLSWRP